MVQNFKGKIAISKAFMDAADPKTIVAYMMIYTLARGQAYDKLLINKDMLSPMVGFDTKNALSSLQELGMIKRSGKYSYELNPQSYTEVTAPFVIIYDEEFIKITDPKILKYYLYLVLTFKNGKEGFMPLEYISNISGLAKSTIQRYNKKLEEMGIIEIAHGGYDTKWDSKQTNKYYRKLLT